MLMLRCEVVRLPSREPMICVAEPIVLRVRRSSLFVGQLIVMGFDQAYRRRQSINEPVAVGVGYF
jgi:hypothetical protein